MKKYTLAELSRQLQKEGLVHLKPRNIRYYQEIGLLRNIIKEKGKKYFTDEHVHYLRAMQTLKKTGICLEEIKRTLNPLSVEELRQLGNQLFYHTPHHILSTHTHAFSRDVSITYTSSLPHETRDKIIQSVQSLLQQQKSTP